MEQLLPMHRVLSALLTCTIGLRVSSANKVPRGFTTAIGNSFLSRPQLAPSAQRRMTQSGSYVPHGFEDQAMMPPLRQPPAPTRIVTVSATDSDEARNPSVHAGSGAIFQVTEALQTQ